VGRPEGKRPFGRPRRRWEHDIKTRLKEVAGGARTELIWIRVGTDGLALLNAVKNLRVP